VNARTLMLGAVLAAACVPKIDALEELAAQEPSGAPVVLVVRGESHSLDEVMSSLDAEIAGEYDLLVLPLTRDTDVEMLDLAIDSVQPKALLLMDNPAVELYRDYRVDHASAPPGVGVMSLFLEESAKTTDGLTGIAYEVPAVTSFVNLRKVVKTDVVKVGVVHRPQFAGFIERQAEIARMEGFEVVPVELSARPGPYALKRALTRLRTETDALWVLNDNALLAPDMLTEVWMPYMRKNDEPVLVGVEPLVHTPTPFGTFAVLPDHDGLGLQTADLLFDLDDSGWDASQVDPQLPIAVKTVLNVSFAREHLGVNDDQLDSVDRLVE